MTTYINTPAGSGTDNTKCTISFWLKQTHDQGNSSPYLFSGGDGASNNFWIRLNSDGRIYLRNRTSSGNDCAKTTNALIRDFSAWYHLVFELDSTQSTAENRNKIWINGVLQTSFDTNTNMTQNNLWHCYGSTVSHIGKRVNDGSSGTLGQFNMSHFHYIDGTAYDASYFGSTDSTTGEWKINTSPNVTYGSRGFFILKDGNSVTDQSGEGNNCTVAGGTLTKTEDNPSNNFATLNPLDIGYTSNLSLANGNNTTNQTSNWGDYGIRSTLAAASGKYYWEAKIATSNTLCILPMDTKLVINMSDGSPENHLYGVQRYSDSTINIYDNGTFTQNSSTMWGGITSSDIISFALDMDNNKLFLAKNGAYKNQSGSTGDPVNGTNPTFTISDTTRTYGFYSEMRGNDNNGTLMNFGNGYFGTTAVSSAGTNASNNGIFEYDVPTGYTALSTKGLNS